MAATARLQIPRKQRRDGQRGQAARRKDRVVEDDDFPGTLQPVDRLHRPRGVGTQQVIGRCQSADRLGRGHCLNIEGFGFRGRDRGEYRPVMTLFRRGHPPGRRHGRRGNHSQPAKGNKDPGKCAPSDHGSVVSASRFRANPSGRPRRLPSRIDARTISPGALTHALEHRALIRTQLGSVCRPAGQELVCRRCGASARTVDAPGWATKRPLAAFPCFRTALPTAFDASSIAARRLPCRKHGKAVPAASELRREALDRAWCAPHGNAFKNIRRIRSDRCQRRQSRLSQRRQAA